MKYTTYIIFAMFITVSILFLKSALKPEVLPVMITGSEKCGTCHSLKNIGNQQKIWENSEHSKAYNSLLSEKAINFARTKRIENPISNKTCLRCHTTKGFLNNINSEESYKIDEGVGCESCHGAGSWYSPAEIMKDESLFEKNLGQKSNEETCFKCHSGKPSDKNWGISENVCPFQEKDFNFQTYFEKIKHPVLKK